MTDSAIVDDETARMLLN